MQATRTSHSVVHRCEQCGTLITVAAPGGNSRSKGV